jgi:hypothetical protein
VAFALPAKKAKKSTRPEFAVIPAQGSLSAGRGKFPRALANKT